MVPSEISEKLQQSEEFVKVSTAILDSVRMAAENVSEHLKSDTFDFSDHAFKTVGKTGRGGHGDESMCSTNDGFDLMFMSPNNYKTLAKDLNPGRVRMFICLSNSLLISEKWKTVQLSQQLCEDGVTHTGHF